jgi:hypothetical protein
VDGNVFISMVDHNFPYQYIKGSLINNLVSKIISE